MQIKTKIVNITSNSEVELLEATTKTIIKSLSIVLKDETDIKTINLYVKDWSSSAVYLYKKAVSKDGIYLNDLFLETWKKVSIESPDLWSGEQIDVILQYIEL